MSDAQILKEISQKLDKLIELLAEQKAASAQRTAFEEEGDNPFGNSQFYPTQIPEFRAYQTSVSEVWNRVDERDVLFLFRGWMSNGTRKLDVSALMRSRFTEQDDLLISSLEIDEGKYTFSELKELVGLERAERVISHLGPEYFSEDFDELFDDPDDNFIDE